VQALGKDKESLQVILVQLVNLLREGEPVAMSTRAGEFVTLTEVCEEVGVDAARFIFLTRKSDSHLDFDLEVVKKKSLDNPVYYVQYAHARICSLMQKAREKNINIDQGLDELLPLLNTEEDMAILKHLDQFSDILITCARTLSPHHLSYYLQELAGLLHRYYTVHPVLNAQNTLLIQARMVLFQAVAQVLKNGLTLLGVNAPQRM
jgi:arginyl-tRNA synthetase